MAPQNRNRENQGAEYELISVGCSASNNCFVGFLPGISGFLHSQTALWNFFYVILGFHRGNEILVFVIEIRRFVDTGKGTGGAVKQKESCRGLRERGRA